MKRVIIPHRKAVQLEDGDEVRFIPGRRYKLVCCECGSGHYLVFRRGRPMIYMTIKTARREKVKK